MAYPEEDCGVAAGGLAREPGSDLDKSGDAVAGCVVPELVATPCRAGVSDDLSQAVVAAIRNMGIIIRKRFTGILLLL